jgi:CMP-2-keto-3-deoxyoctulosonic acid synthetase
MTAVTDHDAIGVDTPADLERVRRLVAAGAHV